MARIFTHRWQWSATAAAVSICAFAAQSVAHELLGHGSACLMTGNRPVFFDSINLRCSGRGPWIDAGGPIANLLFGAAALAAFWRRRLFTPFSFFLWMFAATNLLIVTGYMVQSGWTGRGDWYFMVEGLPHPGLWRKALVLAGIAGYYWTLRLLCRSLIRAVSRGELKHGDLWPLMLSAYFTCGIFAVASGALNPDGVVLLWRNAVAESFGGLVVLLLVPGFVRARSVEVRAAQSMPSSWAWIVLGAVVALGFVLLLGPGVRL